MNCGFSGRALVDKVTTHTHLTKCSYCGLIRPVCEFFHPTPSITVLLLHPACELSTVLDGSTQISGEATTIYINNTLLLVLPPRGRRGTKRFWRGSGVAGDCPDSAATLSPAA